MNAKIIENKASGRTEKNSQRQFKESRINPARVGPMAGANIMTRPIVPMAAPRFSGG
ncbi:hypothetical protein D3C81_1226450 [compost metagenome]